MPDCGIVAPEWHAATEMLARQCVEASPQAPLASHGCVVSLPVAGILVVSDDDLGDNVRVVNKCVVCHQENVTVSVPAVNVVTVTLPVVTDEDVKPEPTDSLSLAS